ncbi:hypothetical protein ACQJBY_030518 [Aegilops geniculata]
MSTVASSSNRSRGQASRSVDRLSSLPDPLLHLVMSFLPMPEVVRTSLLSPRWRYLWASVPFIHLDYKDFVTGGDDLKKRKIDQNRLQKFGDQLLLLRDGTLPLDEAQIFIRSGPIAEKCCTWIRHAIRHKARLLHVYGLSIGQVIFFDNRLVIPSQHLKRIRLQMVTLDSISFRMLNFDFPALEHLELEDCNVWPMQKISSRLLKTIHISFCDFEEGHEICAPNLNHLSILDSTFGGIVVTRDLNSLVAVSIRLDNQDGILDHRIFDGLSQVTTLELHAPLPEPTLERSLQTCPVFSNLTSLVLGEWCMASDFAPLLLILRRSPKLKYLTLKLRTEQRGEWKAAGRNPSPRKESSSGGYPSIERTVIYCGRDDPGVSALVKVLLPIVIPRGEISIKGH